MSSELERSRPVGNNREIWLLSSPAAIEVRIIEWAHGPDGPRPKGSENVVLRIFEHSHCRAEAAFEALTAWLTRSDYVLRERAPTAV